MKKLIYSLIILGISSSVFAQHGEDWFYATMYKDHAQTLKNSHPSGINILDTQGDQSAVYVKEDVAHLLHGNVLVHGPGFIYKKSEEDAISFIQTNFERNFDVMEFTITEDAFVNQCLDLVTPTQIEETILMLQDFGTRYHERSEAEQAIYALRDKWQAMATAAGRTDVTFEIVEHFGTPMPSLIMSIEGATQPDEYVIIGGHADSITWFANDAPGADDNASGIGTITEVIRVLMETGYKPQKTVQFMAYAAEEIGLVGSDEIADDYYNDGKNVVAYVQFDMTNFKGSAADIAIIEDNYTSGDLNVFLIELLEHYNGSGDHAISYTSSACDYACSDHASWEARGYLASFPFEAEFDDSNPYIHTTEDLYAVSGNSNHAARFTKLGLEFIIEVAKREVLSTSEVNAPTVQLVVNNDELIYEIGNLNGKIQSMQIIDSSARKLISKSNLESSGKINISSLPAGIYVVSFKSANGKNFVKKFLVK